MAASPVETSDEQISVWADSARQAKLGGNLSLAEAQYRKIVAARPQIAEARSNLGVVQYMRGECGEALTQFQEALRYKPNLYTPLLFSGICEQKLHRYRRSIPYLKLALQVRPTQSEAQLYLGLGYSNSGEEDEASQYLKRFSEENPNEIEGLFQLGASYLRLSRINFDKASEDEMLFARKEAEMGESQGGSAPTIRKHYEEAIAFAPSYPNLHWALARVLLRAGDLNGAKSAIADELNIDPGHVPGLLLESELYRRSGEYAREAGALKAVETVAASFPRTDAEFARLMNSQPGRARSLLNALIEMSKLHDQTGVKALDPPLLSGLRQTIERLWAQVQLRPNDDFPLELYCEARLERGEAGLLRGQISKLLRRSPDRPMLAYLMGRIYRRLSLASYRRMTELAPDDYRALLLRAETLDNQHYDNEAEQAYQNAVRIRPDAAGIHYRLGMLFLRKHDFEKAAVAFRQELKLDGFDIDSKIGLAESQMEEHNVKQAILLLEEAIKQDPDRLPALISLARAYNLSEKPALAAALFEQAVKLNPKDSSTRYQLAQTYQMLGRRAEAASQFVAVRRIRSAAHSRHSPAASVGAAKNR